jgi:hypothetical protein
MQTDDDRWADDDRSADDDHSADEHPAADEHRGADEHPAADEHPGADDHVALGQGYGRWEVSLSSPGGPWVRFPRAIRRRSAERSPG